MINREDSIMHEISTAGEQSFLDEKEVASNFTFSFVDAKISGE